MFLWGSPSPTHPPTHTGDEAHGWSEELSFTMPRPGFPLRLGMIGDLGQVGTLIRSLSDAWKSLPPVLSWGTACCAVCMRACGRHAVP